MGHIPDGHSAPIGTITRLDVAIAVVVTRAPAMRNADAIINFRVVFEFMMKASFFRGAKPALAFEKVKLSIRALAI
jgi:hypothetical protein